jgi:hypothetical protein
MGTIDEILRLQREYIDVAREMNIAEAEYKELLRRYGSPQHRQALHDQLKSRLSERVAVGADDHPDPFDSRHNLQVQGKKRIWTNIQGCPSCDSINEKYGRNGIRAELAELRRQNVEAREAYLKYDEAWSRHKAVVDEFAPHIELLPSYTLRLNGSGGVADTGPIRSFEVGGQLVLEEGTYVDYDADGKTARAVLDSSGQLVAYQIGGSHWTLMRVPARPRIVTRRGWYSVMRQDGTIEMMIGPDGESTNSYPHVHVIHDESTGQIRVVASRSSSDHSAPEVLPYDADGNEVNAAIERAIRLLQ